MATVLVTGGRGGLGSELTPRLRDAGYTVCIMSRSPAPAGGPPAGMEWAQADVRTGAGLAEAMAGADVVVHTATRSFRQARETEVGGTRNVLEAAAAAGVSHVSYISIVGVDQIPFAYYQHKLAAEELVEQSSVPWSILRATQFHTLIDRFLRILVRTPVALLPKDFRFQPVDTGDVAARMVTSIVAGPGGRLTDFGGPETLTFAELARPWLAARRKRSLLVHLPTAGGAASGFRRGLNTTAAGDRGAITWVQWLERTYGAGS
jgi:uncharacterized protein YbjT (DUF2867 family)